MSHICLDLIQWKIHNKILKVLSCKFTHATFMGLDIDRCSYVFGLKFVLETCKLSVLSSIKYMIFYRCTIEKGMRTEKFLGLKNVNLKFFFIKSCRLVFTEGRNFIIFIVRYCSKIILKVKMVGSKNCINISAIELINFQTQKTLRQIIIS